MDELLQEFLNETAENLEIADNELVKFERDPDDKEALATIFRLVHTVKGSCGFIGLPRLERVAHAAETLLGRVRDGEIVVDAAIVTATLDAIDRVRSITAGLAQTETEPEGDDTALIERLEGLAAEDRAAQDDKAGNGSAACAPPEPASTDPSEEQDPPALGRGGAAQTIRVSVDLLEELMTGVSELVLTRNQLMQERRREDAADLALPIDRLSAQIGRLQESVMRTRMQPISGAWNILPRMVRTLSVDLGKRIDLVMEGGDTELDRQMLELIKDPLAHMVRNSADHGLEAPAERAAAGKGETGTISLSATQEGGHITITLEDDGRGINTHRLREKAVASGVMTVAEAKAAGEPQLCRLIFHPGMSTAEAVTNVSGRGVGMDVVRANVEKIGGAIEVDSTPGQGTRFKLRIPLTLAIMPALIVGVGEARFAVPQIAVAELVRTGEGSEHRIEHVAGAPVLRLRGRLLPLATLSTALYGASPDDPAAPDNAADYILVIRSAGLHFGIIVDRIYDTEELVVKPVSRTLSHLPLYSGNAILGDGNVIMILDMNGIAADLADVAGEDPANDDKAAAPEDGRDAMLVFRAGRDVQPFAVPLSLVTRIEDLDAAAVERAGGGYVVQLRERLVPLVGMDETWSPAETGRQIALVFSDLHDTVALAVDEVIDIVDAAVSLEISSSDPARLGTAIIAGKATDLIDVAYLLRRRSDRDGDMHYSARPTPGSIKADILVVDDSPFFRNMLKPLLDSAGYTVTTAAGVDEALAMRESGKRVDLILSDIEMPGKSGLDFARAVRGGGAWAKVPMVALSSLAGEDDMDAGIAAGFDRYVAKFDRERLLTLLATSLKDRAA